MARLADFFDWLWLQFIVLIRSKKLARAYVLRRMGTRPAQAEEVLGDGDRRS